MKNSLFSVILLHYNQPRYVLTALQTILSQDYENIELVFADDASVAIDLEQIQAYIEQHKGDNIQNVIYSINEENVGTVKTLNRAVKKCNGEYILFFAADDALCNESVISNYKKAFDKSDDNVYMISSQCYMMDINMEKKIENFVKPTQAASFNNLPAIGQYKVFCQTCFLAIGATAMRRDMFEKFGYFNEEYKFVEDWSYFLHLTRNGGLVRYIDFEGLLHRDGGVSHYVAEDAVPPHVMAYKYDIIKILENEIIPYLKQFEPKVIIKTLNQYAEYKKDYFLSGGTLNTMSMWKLVSMHPSFYIQSALFPMTKNWEYIMHLTRNAAHMALVVVGCFLATMTVPEFIRPLFTIAYFMFLTIFFVTIGCIFSLGIIKVLLRTLQRIKKLIRRLK